MPCSLQTSVHGIANIIQVRSVDADFSWLSTPDAHIPICVCNLYLVITVRDVRVLSLRTKVQAGMWPGETLRPLLLWCVCVRSGTLHQAMCDDKAAALLLSFDVQQQSNASLQSTAARYDHHHANTSVSLA